VSTDAAPVGHPVRMLGPDDLAAFRRIRLEALRTEPAAFASTAADWEALSDDEWLARLTSGPVFAAFRGNEAVGLMGLRRERSRKTAHRATIIMVYVRQSERGTGVAAKLLRCLTEHARDIGVRQLELAVSAENPQAIRYYEREGFARIGRIPGGFLHDGKEVDEIMMARRIDR
jgi:RimJ/RimL family protein N-acetyltransferase